jgi:beta-N-acetylhexosaminidase
MVIPDDNAKLCGALILGGYLGEQPTNSFLSRLAAGHLAGAILFRRNLPDLQAGYETARTIIRVAPSDAPPWIAVDQEGGRVRRLLAPALQLPPMRTLGGTGDASLVERAMRTVGRQLAVLGFNLDFAPVLDVDTNPDNPVIGDRSFGRDARTVAELGCAAIRGLQSAGVSACGKHFPGHGDTSTDSHLELPRVDTPLDRMRRVELVPFAAAVRCGVDAIMSAHIVCSAVDPQVPATLSHRLMTGLIRDDLGFGGVVFTDDLEMKAIAGRYGFGDAAVAAIEAGCDVVCISQDEDAQQQAHAAIVRQCERDARFRARCAQAARRSLTLRRRRRPVPSATWEAALQTCVCDEATALTQEIAARCTPRA